MDVILTAQSLPCKYKETFIEHPHNNRLNKSPRLKHQLAVGQWQLIIKVAGAKGRKPHRSGIAYEAVNI